MSAPSSKIKVTKEMRNKMNEVTKVQEANGFTALNCEDGYRKDNRLWFGECSECGERITNSALDGVWKHTIYFERGWYNPEWFEKRIMPNYSHSKDVDYCPKTRGEDVTPKDYLVVDGEKVYA
jgi:hypothetical protein